MSNAQSTDININNKPEVIEHLDCVKRIAMVEYIVLVITTSHVSDFMKKYDRIETEVHHGKFKFSLAYAAVLKHHRSTYSDAVVKFRMTAYEKSNHKLYSISRFKEFMQCVAHETKQFLFNEGNLCEDGVHCSWSDKAGEDAWLSFHDAVNHEQVIAYRDADIAHWETKSKENIDYADASELYKDEANNG